MKQEKHKIQFHQALEKTNLQYGRSLKRLGMEVTKLDPSAERAMAEEDLVEDARKWPKY